MKRANIIKNGQVTNQAEMPEEKLLEWLEVHKTMRTFGAEPYSYQKEVEPAVLAEDGSVVSPAKYETVEVPGEYELVIEDITKELEDQDNKKNKLKKLRKDLKELSEDNWKAVNSIAELKKVVRTLVDILED